MMPYGFWSAIGGAMLGALAVWAFSQPVCTVTLPAATLRVNGAGATDVCAMLTVDAD